MNNREPTLHATNVRASSECDRYKKKCKDDLVPLDGDWGGRGGGTATPARPVSQLAICCPPYGSISLARQTKHQEEINAKISSKTSFVKTDVYAMQLPFSGRQNGKTLPIFLA